MCAVTLHLQNYIRSIPDFPEPGILFRDFSPLLMDAPALRETIERLAAQIAPLAPDYVLGPEARGFVFGPAVACEVGAGFVPVRKPGKLPPELLSHAYDLEYGRAELQLTPFDELRGARVVLHDDLLATGGTVDALAQLARRAGALVVGAAFVIELSALGGRERLSAHVPGDAITHLIAYD